MYDEGLRQGTVGWTDEIDRQLAPWGFDFNDIECPTMVWTAGGDGFTPAAHAETIAAQLSPESSRLYMVPGNEVGHFGAMEIKPSVYAWPAGREDLVRFPVNPPPGHPPGAPILTTLEQWTSLAEPPPAP